MRESRRDEDLGRVSRPLSAKILFGKVGGLIHFGGSGPPSSGLPQDHWGNEYTPRFWGLATVQSLLWVWVGTQERGSLIRSWEKPREPGV